MMLSSVGVFFSDVDLNSVLREAFLNYRFGKITIFTSFYIVAFYQFWAMLCATHSNQILLLRSYFVDKILLEVL